MITEKGFRSRLHLPQYALLAALVVYLTTACGGQGTGPREGVGPTPDQAQSNPASAGAVDPCVLITGAEAEQVLGAPPGEAERPREANNPYLSTCRYTAPRGQGVVVLAVMVHSRELGKRGFQTAKEQPFDIEPVTDVGDDAFWIGPPLNTLYVLKGDVFFTVGGDIELNQVRPLAERALERMR